MLYAYRSMLVPFLLIVASQISSPARCNEAKKERPTLLQVAIYTGVFDPGKTVISFRNSTIAALHYFKLTDTEGFGRLDASLAAADRDSLRDLVLNSGLRGFRPRIEWFRSESLRAVVSVDCSYDLVLTWSDCEMAYTLPPVFLLRNGLRRGYESKERVYWAMYEIKDAILALGHTYSSESSVMMLDASREQIEVARIQKEIRRYAAVSLPRGRKGW